MKAAIGAAILFVALLAAVVLLPGGLVVGYVAMRGWARR